MKTYGSAGQILATFNPDKQRLFAMDETRCLVGTAPSLARMAQTYGQNVALSWVSIQVNNLIGFAGIEGKRETSQTDEIAVMLFSDAPYLKLTEWMLFFFHFKGGRFGRFYGSIDGIKIMEALQEFKSWRMKELQRLEAEAAKAKKAEEDKAHDERVRQFRAEGGRPNVQQLLQEIQAEREAKRKAEGKSHQQRLAEFKRQYLK